MKKVTKLFLSVAAIGALAAGLATSAMAMTATYDAGTVTISDVSITSAEKTLLILKNDATTVTAEDIVQIDQSEDIASVPVGELAAGTYYVRVGGDGNIDTAEFTVSSDSPYNNPARLLGDVNNSGTINMADGSGIVAEFLTKGTLTGDDLQAADTNESLSVNMADGSAIVTYFLDAASSNLGTKTLADRTAPVSVEE